MLYRILLAIIIAGCCQAQTSGKTVVFKVRAKASGCTIKCNDSFFLLEINNPITIEVKGRNKNIAVELSEGKIMTTHENTYFVRFTRPGETVISVYQYTETGKKLLATKIQEIRNPQIFFCGIKIDSTSKSIKLRGTNFYAYSDYYKKTMPIISFDMYFVDDTTLKKRDPIRFKSDSCMLSSEMKKRILSFQPSYNYIYFHNIICSVPDGSKRILDPIELNVLVDKNDKEKLSLIYSVKKKKF